jgi:CheY-like chemotaxis protein
MPRILLIEDNEMNRDMLMRRLKREGFDVEVAVDGEEGVQKALGGNADLILLDMSLPVIDGYEAAARIRAGASAWIPIIALTAHAMTGDREKSLAAGCDDYDTKPVDLPRLLAKMKALIAPCKGGIPPSAAR